MVKNIDEKTIKIKVNQKHLEFYDKTLNILEFILDECKREIKYAEYDFLDMPKNAITALDFLISSIGKIQKGQRLALGLDDELPQNEEPEINVVEGLTEKKI